MTVEKLLSGAFGQKEKDCRKQTKRQSHYLQLERQFKRLIKLFAFRTVAARVENRC